MKRFLSLAPVVLGALGLGLLVTAPGRGADEDEEEYLKVKAQVDQIAGMKEAEAKAAAVKFFGDEKARPFLDVVMRTFKHRRYGGFGVGLKKRTDGIEYKIILLATGREKLDGDGLKKQEKDLVEMAARTRAVADLLPHYTTKYAKNAKDQKKWDQFTEQMRSNALKLGETAKAGDPAAFKKVVTDLDASCKDCHSAFRD